MVRYLGAGPQERLDESKALGLLVIRGTLGRVRLTSSVCFSPDESPSGRLVVGGSMVRLEIPRFRGIGHA